MYVCFTSLLFAHVGVTNGISFDCPWQRNDKPPPAHSTISPTDRGEGANHGIADIHHLTHTLLPVLQHHHRETAGPPGLANAITAYETEMIARTGPAVLTSRRACADAHDYARIGEGSPLVSRRVMVTEEE